MDLSRVRIPGTKLQGWRAIAVALLGLYIVLFILFNDRKLEVHFVFFKLQSNELVALIVLVILSFAAGFIVGGRRQRARTGQQQPEPPEVGTPEAATTAPAEQGIPVGEDRTDPG